MAVRLAIRCARDSGSAELWRSIDDLAAHPCVMNDADGCPQATQEPLRHRGPPASALHTSCGSI